MFKCKSNTLDHEGKFPGLKTKSGGWYNIFIPSPTPVIFVIIDPGF